MGVVLLDVAISVVGLTDWFLAFVLTAGVCEGTGVLGLNDTRYQQSEPDHQWQGSCVCHRQDLCAPQVPPWDYTGPEEEDLFEGVQEAQCLWCSLPKLRSYKSKVSIFFDEELWWANVCVCVCVCMIVYVMCAYVWVHVCAHWIRVCVHVSWHCVISFPCLQETRNGCGVIFEVVTGIPKVGFELDRHTPLPFPTCSWKGWTKPWRYRQTPLLLSSRRTTMQLRSLRRPCTPFPTSWHWISLSRWVGRGGGGVRRDGGGVGRGEGGSRQM